MKKSRHSEKEVIAAVKQMEGGRKTADVARLALRVLRFWRACDDSRTVVPIFQPGPLTLADALGNSRISELDS